MQCFFMIEDGRILMLEPVRFHLQYKAVDLLFPEPVCTAELDVFRGEPCHLMQFLKQLSSFLAVFYTTGNIADSVFNWCENRFLGQGDDVMGIILIVIDKVPIAALQGKAEGEAVEGADKTTNGCIDPGLPKSGLRLVPLLMKMWVHHKFLERCIGFQVYLFSRKATAVGSS